jgi:hypothetical protein
MLTERQRGMREARRFKWLILPLVWGMAAWGTIWMFHTAYTAVRDGQITVGYRGGGSYVVMRSQQPTAFWLNVAVWAHLGMLVTMLGVWACTDAIKRARTARGSKES